MGFVKLPKSITSVTIKGSTYTGKVPIDICPEKLLPKKKPVTKKGSDNGKSSERD